MVRRAQDIFHTVTGFLRQLLCTGLCGLMLVGAATPAYAQLLKVPVKPMSPSVPEITWVEGRAKRGACVDASRIAGAEVMDQRTVDIVLRGGERWRLRLARECSHLTFYGGFYYSQAQSGQICAGRDRIVGRAGGDCLVQAVVPLKQKRR